MVQLNSGDNVLSIREIGGSWQPIEDAYFEEGKCYEWKCSGSELKLLFQSIPMPMTKLEVGWYGTFEMPFQTGEVQLECFMQHEQFSYRLYVYPDKRKLSQQAFHRMLQDILQEAVICFQQTGFTQHVSASNFTKKPSILQWRYIEQNMLQLRTIFLKISERPLRKLKQHDEFCRREHVKQVTNKTMRWLEIYGPARGSSPSVPSEIVRVSKKQETYDVFENRVIVRNLTDLQNLLRIYKLASPEIKHRAEQYLDWISSWKRQPFLKNVPMATGSIPITQVFRKHPTYRLWFDWFYALNEFKDITLDMKHPLALKDTFVLYEMWCFMQIIKCVRQLGLLDDSSSLIVFEDAQYFLHLKENHESEIRLKDGGSIYFQKTIQSNSNPYYSYTQRMIPDIVIEKEGNLYILDPKYRVHANIHMALAEMHKYRDGILCRETDNRVVKEVYILTPQQGEMSAAKDFYNEDFQRKYQMGAFCVTPGEEPVRLREWIARVLCG